MCRGPPRDGAGHAEHDDNPVTLREQTSRTVRSQALPSVVGQAGDGGDHRIVGGEDATSSGSGWRWSPAGPAASAGPSPSGSPPPACGSCWPTWRRRRSPPPWPISTPGVRRVIGVPTDVAVAADVERVRDRALEAFGAVHVVCNNAGVGGGGDHRRAARALGLGARGEPLRGGARRAHLPAAPARAGRGSHREHRVAGGARRGGRARHLLHVEVRRRRAERVVAPRPRGAREQRRRLGAVSRVRADADRSLRPQCARVAARLGRLARRGRHARHGRGVGRRRDPARDGCRCGVRRGRASGASSSCRTSTSRWRRRAPGSSGWRAAIRPSSTPAGPCSRRRG